MRPNRGRRPDKGLSAHILLRATTHLGNAPEDYSAGRYLPASSNVRGAWIKEQKVTVEDGRISAYRVNMQVTFVLGGEK